MSSKPNKRESLLTQFENMHKQLSEDYENKSETQTNADDVTHGGSTKKANLFSSVLNKRDKTNSMPVFAGSPAHNGVLSANSGKDMNFVMSLSENLLVECRRLQAENEKKTSRLNLLEEERERLEEEHEKLDSHHQLTSKELTAFKDTNWELEVKLQQFSVEFKELKDKLNKNKKELKAEQENSKTTKAELEVSKLQRVGLEKELTERQKEYSTELSELRKNVSELNDENDSLYDKIKTLHEKITEGESLHTQLSESTELVTGLKGQLSELETKVKDSSTECNSLKTQLSESETTANDLKLKLSELEKKNKDYDNLQTELSNYRDNVKSLEQKLATFEATKNSHIDENRALKSNSELVKQEAEELRLKFTELQKQLKKRDDNKHDSLKTELSESKQLIEDLRQQLANKANKEPRGSALEGDIPDAELSINKDSSVPMRKKTNSDEQLVSAINDTNLLALPNDNSSQKKNIEGTTSIDSMIKKVESSGYKVLSCPEFNETQAKLNEFEDPSESYIKSKISRLGKILVSQDSYNKALNPPASKLKGALEKMGYTVMSNENYKNLLASIEAPELEYLENKLAVKGRRTVTEKDFKNYTSPNAKFVENLSKNIGYIAIAQGKYDEMQKKIAEPSVESILHNLEKLDFIAVLTEFGDKHDLVLLNKKDHDHLISTIAKPSKEYLIEKCPGQQIQPISIDEYRGMLQSLENPTLEFMNDKATSMNKKLIPIKTYEKLHTTSENPSVAFLRQHAKKNHLIMLSEGDHNTMQRTLNEPDIEYLQAKAKNHKLLDLETYDKLTETFNKPSLKFLTEKASDKGYDVVSTKNHKELVRKTMQPTEDEITQFARGIGAVVVQIEEFEKIKEIANSPSKEFLVEKAHELSLIVLENSEYQKLKRSSTDKDSIFSSVKGFGFMPVPIPELNTLRSSTLDKSNVGGIEKRLQALGYVAVPKRQYNELNKSVLDRITKEDTLALCSMYSLKPVPLGEYQKLKNDSKPTIYSEDELIEMLKSHGYAVIPVKEHETLTTMVKSPTTEFLEEGAGKHGKVLIERELHEQHINMFDNPTVTFLSEKASALGYKVINEREYEDLKSQINSPSTDTLKKKAGLYDLMLIPRETHDKLMNAVNNPSLATLQTKAASMRKNVVDNKEYVELQRKASSPTEAELEAFAATLNMVLVMKDEHDNLSKQIDHPSLEFLERRLSHFEYVAIPVTDHQKLKKGLEEPSEQFLSEKAASRGMLLMSCDEHDDLLKQIDSPSLEFLVDKLSDFSYVAVPVTDHQNLKKGLEDPSEQFLSEKASSRGMLLLSKDEHNNLLKQIDDPSLKFLEEKLSNFSYVAVPVADHQELKKRLEEPSEEFLSEKASSRGMMLLSKDEHNNLLKQIDDPSLKFLEEKLSNFSYVAVPVADHQELKKRLEEPSEEFLSEKASSRGIILLNKADYQGHMDALENPRLEYLEEKARNYSKILASNSEIRTPEQTTLIDGVAKGDLVAITSGELDNLKNSAENPSSNFMISKLQASKYVVLDGKKFEKIQRQIDSPSLEKVAEHAKKHGHVLVRAKDLAKQSSQNVEDLATLTKKGPFILLKTEEYDALLDSNIEKLNQRDLLKACEKLDLIPVTKADYEKLNEAPDVTRLQEYATELGSVLIPQDDFNGMVSKLERPSKESVQSFAEQNDLLLLEKNSYESLLSRLNNPTKSELEKHSERLGLILVPSEEYEILTEQSKYKAESSSALQKDIHEESERTSNNNLAPTLSKSDVYRVAQSLSLTVLTTDEYESLLSKNTQTQVPTFKDVEEYVSRHNMKLIPAKGKGHSASQSERTAENTDNVPFKHNSVCTIESGSSNYFDTTESRPADLTATKKIDTELLNIDILKEKAAEKGFVLVSASDSNLTSRGNESVRGEEDRHNKIEPVTFESVSREAASLGLVALEAEVLKTLESKAKENTERLEELAEEFGYHVLKNEEYSLLCKKLSENELNIDNIQVKAKELGYYVLNEEQYEEVKDAAIAGRKELTPSEFEKRATELGLIPLSTAAYEELVSRRDGKPNKLSEDDIREKASTLGLRIMPNDVYQKLLSKQIPQELTEEDLAVNAQRLGLKLVDKKSEWTKDDILQGSEKLGLVTLDKEELAKLQGLAKPESLKERAQAANMICLPKSAVITTGDRTNADDMVVIPAAYYKKLLSKEASMITARKQQAEMNKPSVRPTQKLARQESSRSVQSGRPVPKLREQRSINSLRNSTRNTSGFGSRFGLGAAAAAAASSKPSQTGLYEDPLPRTNSMGALSLSTIESLDQPSIIPALTQTVIGEYLYKYYPLFGVGGESRHKRYFWVHPYSMTLYWSPTNPVLENPSNHSAKCAPILKVDSIIDMNPTQGIYHKCLVITTDTRVVKIACPSRQRHNVWYNSLRYLLQRSMDGINIEDIAENPNETMYSGKIFPLSKQPTKKHSRSKH